MGVDFQVNVNVKTNGKEAVDALERQIDKLKNETIKVKMDVDGDSNLRKQIKTLEKQKIKLNVDTGGNKLKSAKKDFQMLKSLASEISQKKIKLAGLDETKNSNQISTLKSQLGQLETSYKTLYSTFGKSLNTQQIGQLQNIFGKSSDRVKELNAKSKDYDEQLNNQNKLLEKFQATQKQLSKYTSDSFGNSLKQKYGNTDSYARIIENLEKAKSLQASLGSEMSKGITSSNFDGVNSDLEEMNSLVQKVTTEFNRLEQPISTLSATKAGDATLNWLKNNSKAAKEYGSALESLAQKQKQAKTYGEANSYAQEVNAIKARAAAEGKTGNSPFSDLKRAAGQIAQFAGVYGMMQNLAFQIPKDMIQAVKDVDTAMTNLYKVTDESTSDYNEYLKESGNTAKELGRNMSSYIEQTSTWAKLGYNLEKSKELAKISSVYANVGEVDDETAVSDIITAMKAYDIAADDSIQIVDKLNKLGNEFATSSADLGEGLSNSASALALGGMDINKSLALLTGGSEITQSAGELGNALKIGQMRVMGMKGELEALGEESEGLESVSKIQSHILNLTKGQVNIMNDADPSKFKEYYDILEGVSEIYDSLDKTAQADLLETLFGKQRGNQGAALIQAFKSGQIQKAYQATLNAEGSAQAEQDKWMDSIEAKVQQFKAQFQELSTSAISSDFFKGAVDGGTSFLNILTKITDNVGILPTLLGGLLTKTGLGKRNAALYKIKQNNRRFINVENFLAS